MAASSAATSTDAVARIDLSMRQATLVQAMTNAACFSMAGIDTEQSGSRALEHLDSFSTVLDGLRNGHEWLGLEAEVRPDMLAEIARMQGVWDAYRPAIQQIVAQDYHSAVMGQILRNNSATVHASNSLAQGFVATLDKQTFNPELVEALFYAAQLRMLSQRVLLEACYVLSDIGGADVPIQMQTTLAEIDNGFAALMVGGGAIPPPPNTRIKRNLTTAKLFWDQMTPVLARIATGEQVEQKDISKLLKFSTSVFKQLNQAVEAYTKAAT